MAKTTDAARGRWNEILSHFGIDSSWLDKKHHACPVSGQGTDRFRYSDMNGSGSYFCACSQGDRDGFGLLECKTSRSFADLAAEVDTLLGNKAEIVPKAETHADRLRKRAITVQRSAYLENRKLEIAPGLQFATGVDYYEDGKVMGKYAAMLGPITRNGRFITFHVTYLENGKKANVPSPRKILDKGTQGAGIELYAAAEEMGVAEGIETAIAAKMLFNMPVHSALNATNLAAWEPPKIAKRITIFADNDLNLAGMAGAYQLAHRLKMRDIDAVVLAPSKIGDWADHLFETAQYVPLIEH